MSNIPNISKAEEILLKAASFAAAIMGLIAIHGFYKNNIWKPNIRVVSVDYKNAVAQLDVNGKPMTIRGDSSFLISYDWAVRFGFTPKDNGTRFPDRIEILKRGYVKDILRNANQIALYGVS